MSNVYQPLGSHFVNGQFLEDDSGDLIEVRYPATGEIIARVHAATPAILEQAITSGRAAQAKWAALSGTERGSHSPWCCPDYA